MLHLIRVRFEYLTKYQPAEAPFVTDNSACLLDVTENCLALCMVRRSLSLILVGRQTVEGKKGQSDIIRTFDMHKKSMMPLRISQSAEPTACYSTQIPIT